MERIEEERRWSLERTRSRSFGITASLKYSVMSLCFETFERMAASCCMELRLPFFDVKVFRFLAAVPWDQKAREGTSKILLRESLKDILPSQIRGRLLKSESTPAIRLAFKNYAQREIQEIFKDPHPLLARMVSQKELAGLYERGLGEGEQVLKGAVSLWHLWYVVSLDHWLKKTKSLERSAPPL